jgi:purine-binding chemotaxis protein CheW
MSASEPAGDRRQYLTFDLAGEQYGIDIRFVSEVLEYQPISRVPSTVPAIRGAINVRGNVLPVVDLKAKFGLPACPVTRRTCLLVVEVDLAGERNTLSLLADAVKDVLEFGPGEIEPAPAFGTQVGAKYLTGMGRSDQKFVLLLDIARILTLEELRAAARERFESADGDPGGDGEVRT